MVFQSKKKRTLRRENKIGKRMEGDAEGEVQVEDEEIVLMPSGADDDETSDEDDEAELIAMMQFVGSHDYRDVLAERQARRKQNVENEVTKRTRLLIEEHRLAQEAERAAQRKANKAKLVMQNLAAANFEDQDDEEEDDSDSKHHEILFQDFAECIKKAEHQMLMKSYDEARDVLSKGLDSFKKATEVRALARLLGMCSLELGEIVQAINAFSLSLHAILNNREQFDRSSEMELLEFLINSHEDIGKLQEASDLREQLRTLKRGEQKQSRKTSKGRKLRPLEGDLAKSMDEAIEYGIKGQFEYLRALMYAFRKPRGNFDVRDLVSHKHRQTGATSLMVAGAKGELSIVKAILDSNSPVNEKANDGSSATDWACKFNSPQALAILLDAGGQFDANVSTDIMELWSEEVKQTITDFVEKKKQNLAGGAKTNYGDAQATSAVQRDLEKWNDGIAMGATLEDEMENNEEWDQFESNRKFGREATFDESLYTTELNVESIPLEVKKAADELAKEMSEGKPHETHHHDVDEEDEYSAVPRTSGADEDGFTDASVLKRGFSRRRKKEEGN